MILGQSKAIVRLLEDDDPETVRLVKEQLVNAGEETLDDLKDLRSGNGPAAGHARDVLRRIEDQDAVDDFGLLSHFFGDHHDLERANWMLARALLPDVDIEAVETKVNAWGRQFLIKSSGAVSSRERVILLSRFMAGELGLRGNTDDYYSERNCLLPGVVETRMGIPITLTLLYRMVAARAGMCVMGVNLPGHFIARHADLYFDPFHRGRIMSKADLLGILAKQHLVLNENHLADASARQVLVRSLANLMYVYDLRQETDKHALVERWIKALTADVE